MQDSEEIRETAVTAEGETGVERVETEQETDVSLAAEPTIAETEDQPEQSAGLGTDEEVSAPVESAGTEDEATWPESELEYDEDGETTSTFVLMDSETASELSEDPRQRIKAVIEAAIYLTDEPLTPDQISAALGEPVDTVKAVLAQLVTECAAPDRGLTVRELAGGYKMATKPEHHDAIRQFVRRLQPPLKLSLPALETLAVIAYKQPITAPEIMEIRGVQGTGVLKTLLDRRLIAAGGRKDVIGKPIMYKTTKEFLIQFGLSSLKELPTLKEFEELGRLALNDEMPEALEAPVEVERAVEGRVFDEETEAAGESNSSTDGSNEGDTVLEEAVEHDRHLEPANDESPEEERVENNV